jgi:peptide/nickel transport system substrate-binding protein
MKQSKKALVVLIVIAAIFTVVFAGCSGKEDNGLRFGFTTEPTTLDPLNPANTADGRSILFNVFEGLVKPNTGGTFLPCIAESWTIDNGARIYTFTLREGVFFHDGSLLSPEDVKFSLDTAIAAGFFGFDRIQEVMIQGENQIRVILKNAYPDFLPFMTIGIVKAGNTDRERDVIGTGPFFIESYTTQRDLVLRRFDNYWKQDIPRLEKVTIVFFANYEAMLTSLRSGNIDGARLTGTQVAQLNHRLFDINHSNSAAVQLLALNNAVPPLDDIRVRKAINYGVNVQEIIDAAFFGQGVHSGSPIIPGLTAYYESSLGYNHEPGTAISLLNEAGFNNDQRINLEITVPSNYTMHVDTAQVIAGQLQQIGINASIKLVDWPTWLSEVYRNRNYQATIISLDSRIVSPSGFLNRYRSNDNENFINFVNEDFDRVYNLLQTETNAVIRNRLYSEAQKIITANAASVFIQDILYYKVFRRGVYGGVKTYPLYTIDFFSIYRIDKN